MYLLRLIRPLNLFIIMLTAVSAVYLIGARTLTEQGVLLNVESFFKGFNLTDFSLLVSTMVFSAAAGNIINDYFDIRADRVNKPNQVIIGKHIKRRWAIMLHWVLNFLSVIIALYLGWKYQNVWFFIFPFLSTVLLWFYSMFLKKKVLWGNAAIALLSAAVPFLSGIFLMEFYVEISQMATIDIYWFGNSITLSLREWIWFWMVFLSGYAFALTLIREIVKDIADIEGDKIIQCSTLPIKYGVKKAKLILVVLHFLIASPLALLSGRVILNSPSFSDYFTWIILGMILLPLIFSLILTITAKARMDYVNAGKIIKLSMLGGLILMGFI